MSGRPSVLTTALALLLATAPALADPRRSGAAAMGAELQAWQADDTRNPAQLWVAEGQALWARPAANRPGGASCAGCHAPASLAGVALRYPAFDERLGRALTLAGRVDQCRQHHQGLPPQGPDGPEVLPLTAWLAHQGRGQPISPPADPRLAPAQARGAQLWAQRLGQLNLSCAQCHDQRAGARLGGTLVPQGHPTAYPVYRLEWQALGSLQRRLRGCLVGVRAEPFAPDSADWVALEAYLMQRAAGMASEGAGLRP